MKRYSDSPHIHTIHRVTDPPRVNHQTGLFLGWQSSRLADIYKRYQNDLIRIGYTAITAKVVTCMAYTVQYAIRSAMEPALRPVNLLNPGADVYFTVNMMSRVDFALYSDLFWECA